jgi:two-component system OmpR family sensor kinase
MNHMAGRIEGLLGAQRNLLHSVSHELRTPIARLEFALTLLASKTGDSALLTRITAMEGDLAELNALVGELLGMTRLDSVEQLDAAPIDLPALLRECAGAMQPAPAGLVCELEQAPARIDGDARLLARAIGNLLRNAEKYAAARIVLSARPCGVDQVEIAVEDDGPGIPLDERERVFEPFYRLDRSRDRATGGFGLGLSIAHKAVALHGGTLRVEGGGLGGARLVLTLPAPAGQLPARAT